MGALALVEVLDRDGAVRQSARITQWPLRVGRALDNDLVLDDPHVAAHHFSVAPSNEGVVQLTVGETLNGLQWGRKHLGAAEQIALGNDAALLSVGRVQLRLRHAGQPLAAEVPMASLRALATSPLAVLALVLAVAAVIGFDTYLVSDPDRLGQQLSGAALAVLTWGMIWCGAWTLLSKVFTRQAHLGWHLRVMLMAVLVWSVLHNGANLMAFALSWPWVSSFSFVLGFAVGGVALYHHLIAVEPQRAGAMRWLSTSAAVSGMAIILWSNWQAHDRFGDELYMNHLFPPALRLAQPVDTATYIERLRPLQATLDHKAQHTASGGHDDELESDDAGAGSDAN